MSHYVSQELRQSVVERAVGLCEYCLIHEEDTYFGCQVDHVISKKHGGKTELDNLAYSCAFCNRHKGTDLGSILRRGGELIRFFNPRIDRWMDHFRLEGIRIIPLTEIGQVTEKVLQLNGDDRLLEREVLLRFGRYPSPVARSFVLKMP